MEEEELKTEPSETEEIVNEQNTSTEISESAETEEIVSEQNASAEISESPETEDIVDKQNIPTEISESSEAEIADDETAEKVSEENQISPREKYKHFTIGLALTDLIPVILFCISSISFSFKLGNTIFAAGAVLCVIAGMLKVIWKILIPAANKDVQTLTVFFRVFMIFGFLVMGAGAFISSERFLVLYSLALYMPTVIFFGAGIVGLVMMIIFAFILDKKKSTANWAEQITNIATQLLLLVGVLQL